MSYFVVGVVCVFAWQQRRNRMTAGCYRYRAGCYSGLPRGWVADAATCLSCVCGEGPKLACSEAHYLSRCATVGRYDYPGGSKLLSSLDLFHLLTRAGQRVVSP